MKKQPNKPEPTVKRVTLRIRGRLLRLMQDREAKTGSGLSAQVNHLVAAHYDRLETSTAVTALVTKAKPKSTKNPK